MNPLVAIQTEAIDVRALELNLTAPEFGAQVTFVGRVRNHNAGQKVNCLEYEAYPSMALREMERIVQKLEQRFPGARLCVVHRIGTLEVGDVAVACVASAAHRGEAFEACRQLIDEIKANVPIWKREFGPDGPYWAGWRDARCHEHEAGHKESHVCDKSPARSKPSCQSLRVSCVTISDTRDATTDVSGNVIEELLREAGTIVRRAWTRDEASQIADELRAALASPSDVVILTGGTGLGPRDVTVEAVTPLLDRQLDGFGEEFRRLSLAQVGVRALLSRAIAGTVGESLVFVLPGSTNAVRLAVEQLIIPLIPHARAMLLGGGHS